MALSWGMSYDLYWHGSLNAFYIYREKHLQEREDKQKQTDFNAWINGLYVEKALQSVLDGVFNGKKAKSKYPDNPILTPAAKPKKEDTAKREETKQAILEHNLLIKAMLDEKKLKNERK